MNNNYTLLTTWFQNIPSNLEKHKLQSLVLKFRKRSVWFKQTLVVLRVNFLEKNFR